MSNRIIKISYLILCCLFALSACGQKGPLYIEGQVDNAQNNAQQTQEAEQDKKKTPSTE